MKPTEQTLEIVLQHLRKSEEIKLNSYTAIVEIARMDSSDLMMKSGLTFEEAVLMIILMAEELLAKNLAETRKEVQDLNPIQTQVQ